MDKCPVAHSWASGRQPHSSTEICLWRRLPLGEKVKFMVFGCTTSTHLHAFLPRDTNANVCHLNHADIVGTVTFVRQERTNRWGAKKRCKLQTSVSLPSKQTNPSRFIPCLQAAWTLAKQEFKVASYCHQKSSKLVLLEHPLPGLASPSSVSLTLLPVSRHLCCFWPSTYCLSVPVTLPSSPPPHPARF